MLALLKRKLFCFLFPEAVNHLKKIYSEYFSRRDQSSAIYLPAPSNDLCNLLELSPNKTTQWYDQDWKA
jgi:hypothetical protein